MKPGRIYYNVDLTEEEMRKVLPYIDFTTEQLVINGYGEELWIEDTCRRCGTDLTNIKGAPDAFFSGLDESPDIYGISRFRCPQCHAPVDDQYHYTGCEDIAEAIRHVFHGGGYRGYQIWPHDWAKRDDVAYLWSHRDGTKHLHVGNPDGAVLDSLTGKPAHLEWLYRDIPNWRAFKAERDAIFAPAIDSENGDLLYDISAYKLDEFQDLLAESLKEAADD